MPPKNRRIHAGVLAAYRWQYIVSGVREPRFGDMLAGMLNERQQRRVFDALAPIVQLGIATGCIRSSSCHVCVLESDMTFSTNQERNL